MRIKIQIFHENGDASARVRTLVETQWIDRDSHKKLTAKQAGIILANTNAAFDSRMNRSGLTKTDDGFYASRPLEPTGKNDYHYVWEIALVMEEAEEV